jgi:hypothetical protein
VLCHIPHGDQGAHRRADDVVAPGQVQCGDDLAQLTAEQRVVITAGHPVGVAAPVGAEGQRAQAAGVQFVGEGVPIEQWDSQPRDENDERAFLGAAQFVMRDTVAEFDEAAPQPATRDVIELAVLAGNGEVLQETSLSVRPFRNVVT